MTTIPNNPYIDALEKQDGSGPASIIINIRQCLVFDMITHVGKGKSLGVDIAPLRLQNIHESVGLSDLHDNGPSCHDTKY